MDAQSVRTGLFYVAPALLVPLALHLLDRAVPVTELIRLGLACPLLSLAYRGLSYHYPMVRRPDRSTGVLLERALLQGAVFGCFIVLTSAAVMPDLAPDVGAILRLFVKAALLVGALNFACAWWLKARA